MDQLSELIGEIRRMNHNIEKLLRLHEKTEPEWYKIPAAAKIFNMSYHKFRTLCIQGVIPCAKTNENPKSRHYIVNVTEAKAALVTGGFLNLGHDESHERKERRGKKSKLSLTKTIYQ